MISSINPISELLGNKDCEIWWPGLAARLISQSEYYNRLAKDYSTTAVISDNRKQPEMVLPISLFPAAKLEMLSAEHAQHFVGARVFQLSLERFSAPKRLRRSRRLLD